MFYSKYVKYKDKYLKLKNGNLCGGAQVASAEAESKEVYDKNSIIGDNGQTVAEFVSEYNKKNQQLYEKHPELKRIAEHRLWHYILYPILTLDGSLDKAKFDYIKQYYEWSKEPDLNVNILRDDLIKIAESNYGPVKSMRRDVNQQSGIKIYINSAQIEKIQALKLVDDDDLTEELNMFIDVLFDTYEIYGKINGVAQTRTQINNRSRHESIFDIRYKSFFNRYAIDTIKRMTQKDLLYMGADEIPTRKRSYINPTLESAYQKFTVEYAKASKENRLTEELRDKHKYFHNMRYVAKYPELKYDRFLLTKEIRDFQIEMYYELWNLLSSSFDNVERNIPHKDIFKTMGEYYQEYLRKLAVAIDPDLYTAFINNRAFVLFTKYFQRACEKANVELDSFKINKKIRFNTIHDEKLVNNHLKLLLNVDRKIIVQPIPCMPNIETYNGKIDLANEFTKTLNKLNFDVPILDSFKEFIKNDDLFQQIIPPDTPNMTITKILFLIHYVHPEVVYMYDEGKQIIYSKRTNPKYDNSALCACIDVQTDVIMYKKLFDEYRSNKRTAVFGLSDAVHQYKYCGKSYIANPFLSKHGSKYRYSFDYIFWSFDMNRFYLNDEIMNNNEHIKSLFVLKNNQLPPHFRTGDHGWSLNSSIKNLSYFNGNKVFIIGILYIPLEYGSQILILAWNKIKKLFELFEPIGNSITIGCILYQPFITYAELNMITKYYGQNFFRNNRNKNVLYISDKPLDVLTNQLPPDDRLSLFLLKKDLSDRREFTMSDSTLS